MDRIDLALASLNADDKICMHLVIGARHEIFEVPRGVAATLVGELARALAMKPTIAPKQAREDAAREALFREAAQLALDQTCDSEWAGDWNSACEHIAARLHAVAKPEDEHFLTAYVS